ncbi:MAG: hypothetical protein P1Q69_01705 [Candidatus Thorarchaeota archaeon]|nr:hypothetical protein [Candidatus Thorarchaeota archaeon]
MEDYYFVTTSLSRLVLLCNKSSFSQFKSIIDSPLADLTLVHPDLRWESNLEFKYLQMAGVVDDDELGHYTDLAYVHIGNRLSTRIAKFYLTNKRMVLVGPFDTAQVGNSSVFRLHYPDMLDKPYHAIIDYIDYNMISDLDNKWSWKGKLISFNYDTSYMQEKSRVLYGPLFFKMDLPKSIKNKQGQLKIDIMLMSRPHPTIDADTFTRNRQEKLHEYLTRFTKHE